MAKFTYTTRSDGRLMKRVSVNGKIQSIYSDNPKDLERQYIELKYKNNRGIDVENNTLTFGEWANTWIKLYKSDKADATIDMYRTTIKLHINPKIGYIKLKSLKQSDIIGVLNEMDQKGITRRKDWALLTIKQILDTAIENDYIYKNVANGIKIKKHKSSEKKPIDSNIIDRIKKLSENDFDAFMILFMIYTGLRREEIVPLQYKDIDLNNKIIVIDKAVHFDKNQPIIKSTKNECSRNVPILNIIYNNLKDLKSIHKNNEYVFPNTLGNIMSETSVKRKIGYVLNRLNKQYEKEQKELDKDFKLTDENKIYFTYHQLRHTYACILHKAGVDLKEAQSFTGHKDVKILLNIYTHLDEEDKKKAVDKLNNFVV